MAIGSRSDRGRLGRGCAGGRRPRDVVPRVITVGSDDQLSSALEGDANRQLSGVVDGNGVECESRHGRVEQLVSDRKEAVVLRVGSRVDAELAAGRRCVEDELADAVEEGATEALEAGVRADETGA